MFSKIGAGEIIVIIVIALLIFGPNKLPQLGKTVGEALKSFKKYMHGATNELKEAVGDVSGIENDIKEINNDVRSTINQAFSLDDVTAKPAAEKDSEKKDQEAKQQEEKAQPEEKSDAAEL